jgi:preprotein translocase subunit YajC
MKSKLHRLAVLSSVFLLSHPSLWAMGSAPADPNAPKPPFWVSMAPMFFMIVVFYFVLIRPQSQQRKKRQDLLNSLKRGDQIVTQSGFIATIVNLEPTTAEVKLNDDVKVRILRSAISEVYTETNANADKTPVAAQ